MKQIETVNTIRYWAIGLLGAVGCLLLTAPAHATLVFSDNFSSGIGAWTTSATAGTVAWDAGSQVKITSAPNAHANLYRYGGPLDVSAVQADINNVSDGGATWGPSVTLYFDKDNWAQMTLRAGGTLEAEYYKNGGQQGGGLLLPSAWISGDWYTMRIALDRTANQIDFLFGPQAGPLATVWTTPTLPDTFNGNGYLILGKGYSASPYNTNPFLQNDAAIGGTQGVSLYDNALFETVPEPGIAALLGLGGLMLRWRRRSA